jgi:HSP20 family molecular chaperone IbpA
MPKNPTTTTSPGTTTSPAAGAEAERVPAAQPAGTERTRERPLYLPRVDIVETQDALEVLADMPGVTRDDVEVVLEQRVLTIRGRTGVAPPEGLAPLHLEYDPGDYERSFTLSDAVDPSGIEARVRGGVLHLRLPKAGPAELRRIEVRAD